MPSPADGGLKSPRSTSATSMALRRTAPATSATEVARKTSVRSEGSAASAAARRCVVGVLAKSASPRWTRMRSPSAPEKIVAKIAKMTVGSTNAIASAARSRRSASHITRKAAAITRPAPAAVPFAPRPDSFRRKPGDRKGSGGRALPGRAGAGGSRRPARRIRLDARGERPLPARRPRGGGVPNGRRGVPRREAGAMQNRSRRR